MYEELFAAAGETGARNTEWESRLPADERELLPAFEEWLQVGDEKPKSQATARAYRAYVAQAMVRLREGAEWKGLTTDIRSAVNAFIRFASALKEAGLAFAEADDS